MQDAERRLRGAGCRLRDAGYRVQAEGCRVQVEGCRVQGAGCGVQGRCRSAGCQHHLVAESRPRLSRSAPPGPALPAPARSPLPAGGPPAGPVPAPSPPPPAQSEPGHGDGLNRCSSTGLIREALSRGALTGVGDGHLSPPTAAAGQGAPATVRTHLGAPHSPPPGCTPAWDTPQHALHPIPARCVPHCGAHPIPVCPWARCAPLYCVHPPMLCIPCCTPHLLTTTAQPAGNVPPPSSSNSWGATGWQQGPGFQAAVLQSDATPACTHGAASCALTPALGLFNTSPFLHLPRTQRTHQERPQKDKSARFSPNKTLLTRQGAGARPAQPGANPTRAPARTRDLSSRRDGWAGEPSRSWGHR